MTNITYIDRTIHVVLKDANGVTVEAIEGPLVDVSQKVREFLVLAAGDTDGPGVGGSVEFAVVKGTRKLGDAGGMIECPGHDAEAGCEIDEEHPCQACREHRTEELRDFGGPQNVYLYVDPLSADGIFAFEDRDDRDEFKGTRKSPEGFVDDTPLLDREGAREMIQVEGAAQDDAGSDDPAD